MGLSHVGPVRCGMGMTARVVMPLNGMALALVLARRNPQ